jgi:hypothetical protein
LAEKEEKYVRFLKQARDRGCFLDNISYPSLFGPKGELMGIALAKDVGPGEVIMSYPFSVCTSKATILASDLGQWIRKLELPDTCDEELYICLFFMNVLVQGESNPAYYSLNTA